MKARVVAGGKNGGYSAAETEVVAAGRDAIPPLLDALYRLSLGAGFEDAQARDGLSRVDRVLGALRQRVSPGRSIGGDSPWTEGPAVQALRRVEEWFRWWDEIGGDRGG